MTESDIMYESNGTRGHYWVMRDRKGYRVLKTNPSFTHSISDSLYPKNKDGLSCAIARCHYLANGPTKQSIADIIGDLLT